MLFRCFLRLRTISRSNEPAAAISGLLLFLCRPEHEDIHQPWRFEGNPDACQIFHQVFAPRIRLRATRQPSSVPARYSARTRRNSKPSAAALKQRNIAQARLYSGQRCIDLTRCRGLLTGVSIAHSPTFPMNIIYAQNRQMQATMLHWKRVKLNVSD